MLNISKICRNMKNMIISGQSWCRGTKCDCKHDWSWVRSPLEKMKYLFKMLYFLFLRSGDEAKPGLLNSLKTKCPQNSASPFGLIRVKT